MNSGTELGHGNLATQVQGGLRLAMISNLESNTDYTIRIYAGAETVGYPFDVTTFPSRKFFSSFFRPRLQSNPRSTSCRKLEWTSP